MPKIQMRRDTSANWKSVNPTLLAGEWALETDTKKVKIGDGATSYNSLTYFREEDNEWVKPSDWIDIRSGALPNSVYFLVGHSAPTESGGTYTVDTYPLFAVNANVSNSGTYDVFVDGLKIDTTSASTMTVIDWGALYTNGTLVGGHNVTYPTNLVTHVVRVTPTDSTNTLSHITTSELEYNSSYVQGGTLWIHFTLSNSISIKALAGSSGDWMVGCPILETITAKDNVVHVSNIGSAFAYLTKLKTVPIFDGDNQNILMHYILYYNSSLKKLHLRNFQTTSATYEPFINTAFGVFSELILENSKINWSQDMFALQVGIKKIPEGFIAKDATTLKVGGLTKVEDTILDFSDCTNMSLLEAYGAGQGGCPGVKGITVSSSAPFDSATSPQLNVANTGLDRVALVNLFNSMPTVTDGQVVDVTGTTGASDLTASDLAIATGKGWTVTR